ncbi:MAG: type IV pilus twitching motility protein PilT [Clostridia bacterium]|nr:type IV pilus twitching motility protein PilT [Clostridia bacterium]
MTIADLLRFCRAEGCSDLHLSQGLPMRMRKNGVLVPVPGTETLSPAETAELICSLLDEGRRARLEAGEDLDFACETGPRERCRVNVYRQRLGLAAAVRILRDEIPSLEALGLPPVLRELCSHQNGLVLITGPTGSGKSTTLAAMIDHISRQRSTHILTVEDPIEYVFEQHLSLVHQREVGAGVGSFAGALRSALREDPDVLLVGEMRDYETISTAVTAAETGHLVLSTLHTTGAAQTIDRIVDSCPPEAQKQMRSQLSMILRGVVTQQLLPLSSGGGRVAATEVLIGTDAVANMIRENRCFQLPSIMQAGLAGGMHTMNADLARLVREGKIAARLALERSNDRGDFKQYME